MKFSISTTELKKKFNILANAIATNPIVPSLENYLVEFFDQKLYITSSDLHTYIKTNIEMAYCEDNIPMKKFCMPAKKLNEIVKSLDDQDISFVLNEETFGLQLETKNGVYKLICESAADFPQLKDELINNNEEFFFLSKKLKNILTSLLVTTSNKNELSPSITGLFFEKKGDEIKFVTTDEHRISIYGLEKIAKEGKDFSLILPKRSVSIISSIMPLENVKVRVDANDSAMKISIAGTEIYIKAMKERFPNYNLVIPKDANKSILINRKNFLTSLKRTSIFANQSSKYALIVVEDNTLIIITKDMDFNSEATEAVPCDYVGEKIMSGFNISSLAELISTLDGDFLEIKIKDNNSPCLLKPTSIPENENHIALIMPMIQGS